MNVVPSNDGTYKLVIDFTPSAHKLSRIMTDESELHRIIQHLNPEGVSLEGRYRYFEDIIVIKAGNSTKYEYLVQRGDVKRRPEDIGVIEVRTFADSEKSELLRVETYKHLIVNASHVRSKKAFFVNTANGLYDKVDEIIRCGIPKSTKVEYITKWTSYFGLQASNSIPVTMPKCVITKDLFLKIPDKVDVVKGTAVYERIRAYKRKPDVYGDVKHFDVIENQEIEVPTCPFDGMGICDVGIARQWAEDLRLDYIPGSFQIRLCGIKGCLFVMDIQKFITEIKKSGTITDIDNEEFDFENGDFNVILTESMFKYGKFYNEDKKAAQWKREFEKELYGYKRTFNICSYAQAIDSLSDTLLSAYQPLQSLPELQHIPKLCEPTVEILKGIHGDIDKFLNYFGINDTQELAKKTSSVPPYFKALHYNHSLASDPYVKSKIDGSLQTAINRSLTGKLYMNGNYTVVGSDPFALLQWAFSLDSEKVTGLLDKNELYSNYWNRKNQQKVNIWRNPHIYTEHWIGNCKNNQAVNEWFGYLQSNTIVSVWDTNLLRMNSADCDGDTVATVNNRILLDEVEKALSGGKANTIHQILEFGSKKNEDDYSEIGDIKKQILSEINGFKNDIGTCTNCISSLWGVPQDNATRVYLKTLSVVDSLIIDFPKTSEKTDIPSDIKKYIKEKNIRKQEFMKYLPGNKELRIKEERLPEGTESLFSHDDCTLNKICWYMKAQMEGVKKTFTEPEFDFKMLIRSVDKNIQYRQIYKAVLKKLDLFYRYQQGMNIEKKYDSMARKSSKNDDYAPLYKAFYSSCKYDMLLSKEDDRYVSKDIILDCCIIACYTEKRFLNKLGIFDLLWSMFPNEMVQRVKGKISTDNIEDDRNKDDRNKFAQAIIKKQEYGIKTFEREKESKRINRIGSMVFLQGNQEFFVYKDEISLIKALIPTSIENYIIKRKLLYILLISEKKIKLTNGENAKIPYISNSRCSFNDSVIGKLLNISGRAARKELQWLYDNKFITMDDRVIQMNRCKISQPKVTNDSVIYFNGSKFLSGVKVMNRYLSK